MVKSGPKKGETIELSDENAEFVVTDEEAFALYSGMKRDGRGDAVRTVESDVLALASDDASAKSAQRARR